MLTTVGERSGCVPVAVSVMAVAVRSARKPVVVPFIVVKEPVWLGKLITR
jgi:hypothetical protein